MSALYPKIIKRITVILPGRAFANDLVGPMLLDPARRKENRVKAVVNLCLKTPLCLPTPFYIYIYSTTARACRLSDIIKKPNRHGIAEPLIRW